MSGTLPHRLSGEEVAVLRFAAHRQLARWAKTRELDAHRREQRAALISAVRTLEHRGLAHGCELRATTDSA